ncbi:MAG: NAD-dependent epimerase/dehydratase family protein [Rhodanobacteraceae bacterium]
MSYGTCLVTGGAGFIGCAVSGALTRQFERVVALDNLHPQVHADRCRPSALHRRVELVVGDVADPEVWDAMLANISPNAILHLAAETGTGQSLVEASRHAQVNVTGTATMLDALVRHQRMPERIVLTSSRAVYGEGAWRKPGHDIAFYPGQRSRAQLERGEWDFPGLEPVPFSAPTTVPHPTSVYGATKLAQEQILRAWACAFDVEAVVLRLQNVYGPGQSLHNPYTGICSLFARLARDGQSIPIYEDGRIVRDFVFIDDVAAAIVAALTGSPRTGEAYDIGSGAASTVEQLADLIAERYAAPAPRVNGAFRHGDVRHAACTIDRAEIDLDWRPRVRLGDGIARLCAWIDAESATRAPRASAA